MKKIVSLLLSILMMLSFSACGREETRENSNTLQEVTLETTAATENNTQDTIESIEITRDNWQNYLELRYMISWKYNAFDEIEGFSHLYPVLALKEEYMDRKVSANTELAVGFTATRIWKCVSVDMESRTYKWGESIDEKEQINETAKYYPEVQVGDPRILDEGGIVFLSYGSRHVNGKDGHPYYENFEITRIEGTLVFE